MVIQKRIEGAWHQYKNINVEVFYASIFVGEEQISWSKLLLNMLFLISQKRWRERKKKSMRLSPKHHAPMRTVLCNLKTSPIVWDLHGRKVGHLASVCDSDAFRQAMATMLPKVSVFTQSLYLNDDLWKCVEATYQAEQARTGVIKRHMEEVREQFIQNGAQLEGEQKSELAEISKELAEITKEYSNNVLDSTNGWEPIITDEA